MMSRFTISIVGATISAVTATGCGCDADLATRVSPAQVIIQVGEAFTPTLRFFGCGNTEPLNDVIRWSTPDTLIITVDSISGRTVGRARGEATVVGKGRTYGTGADIPVTVR
jgi:hypothetical protein